jgi:integrase
MTAMVLFLLDSGVRVGEMLKLKLADLDLEQGRAKVMGKGAKERYVYFGRATKRVLWRYISLARPEPAPNVENLFLTIVPLTDWKERYEIAPWMVRIDPDTANGLSKPKAADAFQIRSVSQARFVNRMGRISNVHLQEILKAIQTVIGV